jgi:para-aminobenzoate synthetase component 1
VIKFPLVPDLPFSADDLVSKLLAISENETVFILDSCGVSHLGSRLLIAGVAPVNVVEIYGDDVEKTLATLDQFLSGDLACIFTLSYDFGRRMLGLDFRHESSCEPDVFVAQFADLIVHDHETRKTGIVGGSRDAAALFERLLTTEPFQAKTLSPAKVTSNFAKHEYLTAIEVIQERIRRGDTYQTNLTHQLKAELPREFSPQSVFHKLRRGHPAPFAAYITRNDSTVVSASPERFFSLAEDGRITTSPIKGTRPRSNDRQQDAQLRADLLASGKDIAENTMIVDLLRNDLGRVCEYGTVEVDKLCDLEEHPTFFNLVSSISGKLRADVRPSDILRAMFPCGSITGAPKISTMKIIDEIETAARGLSMGAIGYYAPERFGLPYTIDLSVAIRTMVVRDGIATFNVGGGITIESDPESEWNETVTKAQALLNAMNARLASPL